MELFHIYAAFAAIGYAVAAMFSKQALARGAGVLRLSFVINWLFVLVFATLLWGHEGAIPWEKLHYPIITGFLFFLGQVFTFTAIRFGDVSLQTPVMGTKAVFAVILAVLLGTEVVTLPMALAAVVSMLGIAFLGFSGDGVERVGRTLCLALLSSFFFAGSDTMVGFFASDFGVPMFLFLAILSNALLSLGLVPFFRESFREMPRAAWPWIMAASLGMALQALLLNYTLATYQNVAAVNVIYTTRGLWSVLLGAVALKLFASASQPVAPKRIFILRLAGAFLMTLAIGILFRA
ncbi:MAG: EamA family transporter [Verrucomicrobia bacterium]|jgi:drug/metabolite transporter (DMT)-like permease|nr:EamA family transporter [Verrucomicrobiota bacterium]